MKIVACYSNKGGVGKTAASVNLAYAFAGGGARVLLCDLDPQGAAGFYFRVKPSQKLENEAFFEDDRQVAKAPEGGPVIRLQIGLEDVVDLKLLFEIKDLLLELVNVDF